MKDQYLPCVRCLEPNCDDYDDWFHYLEHLSECACNGTYCDNYGLKCKECNNKECKNNKMIT